MKRMLKTVASLCLVAMSTFAVADDSGHSMTPFKDKQFTYQSQIAKRYTVSNDTNVPTKYEMVIEDYHTGERELTGQTVMVPAYSSRSVIVKIKNIPADTKVTKYVCSWSVPQNGESFRSEICALLQLYYPQSYLQQQQQQG